MSDILIPHVEPIVRATSVRGTLLAQSVQSLKEHGLFERWSELIDAADRTRILEAIAPEWLPIELGLAHYDACDLLEVDDVRLGLIGEGTGQRVQSTLLATSAKLAQATGMTGVVAAQAIGRIWPRLFQGGSVQLTSIGPKDNRLEVRSAVLTRSRYFRATFCGNVRTAVRLVGGARVVYTRIEAYESARDRFVVVISWV